MTINLIPSKTTVTLTIETLADGTVIGDVHTLTQNAEGTVLEDTLDKAGEVTKEAMGAAIYVVIAALTQDPDRDEVRAYHHPDAQAFVDAQIAAQAGGEGQ